MLKPKSAYIAFEAFPRPKGASSHIASMITALSQHHGPVLLLCLGFGDLPRFQTEGDIIISRFKGYHPNMLKRSVEFADFVSASLARWGDSIDLCVFRDPWGGTPALASGLDIRYLFEVNALPSWELGYTYPEFINNYSLKHKIEDMEYFCLNASDRILTVSDVTTEALKHKGIDPDKITTIPNSAPDIFFRQDGCGQVPDFMKNGRWIGYFGSLHPWQGVEDAVTAFSRISTGFQDVSMLIVTGGRKGARKKLRKRIRKLGLEDRIILNHPMPHETLAPVVRTFEFSLAPLTDTPRNTRQGCCPVKIIESMAAGTPVIASNLSCVRSLIHHSTDGWLVPPGNSRALAIAMNTLLSEPSTTETLSENALNKAKSHFSRTGIHRELSVYFDTTINTKGVCHVQ